MDGMFRTSRPGERRVAGGPAPVRRQPEEHRAVSEPPRQTHHAAPRQDAREGKPFFRRFLWLIVVAVIAVLAAVGWFAWSATGGGAGAAIDSSKYQAVFFTNGQVYFGKLQVANGGYMKLTDIYYLQSQQSDSEKDSGNPQETSTGQNNVQLIKLGDEIHGPEDEMIISKDQMLFFENLKTDGKVTQSIQKFKDSH